MSQETTKNEPIETNGTGDLLNNQPSLNGDADDSHKSVGVIEEKPVDSSSENNVKKASSSVGGNTSNTPVGGGSSGGKPKKRKKAPRDATAPKQPLTGYFRFLNDRREKVRTDNPTMSFTEITKLLAAEWSSLPTEQKQQYLNAAEQDKERYNREFSDYKQTEAYRLFSEKQMEKQNEKKEKNTNENSDQIENSSEKDNDFSGFDIPIFTEEFLDHNKACESELRQLRKATSDYEAQNAVLQRHVDSLRGAVNRLESETNQQQITNQSLQRHLDSLRTQILYHFNFCPLPMFAPGQVTYTGATLENFDGYMERLEALLERNLEPALRNAIRRNISKIDLEG
ncbi:high mobility group protein 20A-like [Chelonus insularis]|uniref:high mobility group protein 20A-like n=1 Tax=Chelonus insularis TaxID=460826 RepID=UPI001588CCC3|nr:high mobility group protein 20A-like [Chelonus insularis]